MDQYRQSALRPTPDRPPVPVPLPTALEPEEAYIIDDRAQCRPAQMVERKLVRVLRSAALPASHVRTSALTGGRSR